MWLTTSSDDRSTILYRRAGRLYSLWLSMCWQPMDSLLAAQLHTEHLQRVAQLRVDPLVDPMPMEMQRVQVRSMPGHPEAALVLEIAALPPIHSGVVLVSLKRMQGYLPVAASPVGIQAYLLIMLAWLGLVFFLVPQRGRQLILHLYWAVEYWLVNPLDMVTALFRLPTLDRWLGNRLASLTTSQVSQVPLATWLGAALQSLKHTQARVQAESLQVNRSARLLIMLLCQSRRRMHFMENRMANPAPMLPCLQWEGLLVDPQAILFASSPLRVQKSFMARRWLAPDEISLWVREVIS